MRREMTLALAKLEKHKQKHLTDKLIPRLVRESKRIAYDMLASEGFSDDVRRNLAEDIEVRFMPTTGALVVEAEGIADLFDAGWDYYDMKPSMLASKSAKQAKDGGKYIDVPIRMGSSSALSQAIERASVMDDTKLGAMHFDADFEAQHVFFAKRLISTGKKGRRGAFRRLEGRHKTGKYLGGSLDSRLTFRRISSNSGAKAWINQGRKSLGLADKVGNELQRRIKIAVSRLK